MDSPDRALAVVTGFNKEPRRRLTTRTAWLWKEPSEKAIDEPEGPKRYVITAVPALVVASIGFVVHDFLAGGTLLAIYEVPPHDATIWSFVIAASSTPIAVKSWSTLL